MAFKQDTDFLRFITMGAAGSAAVVRFLQDRHGHRMVELERYAMANKIWATKIKRLRLADLMCLDCGLRVEARAKSDLKVRMSHSENNPERAWDFGLRDEDVCAFVAWDSQEGSAAERVECFEVQAMRDAEDFVQRGPMKSASEGAERDLTWPARVPAKDGLVEEVDEEAGIVRLRAHETQRRQPYRVRDMPSHIYVEEGEEIKGGERFVVGCLEKTNELDCPGHIWDYKRDFRSSEASDRYAAVKAAGFMCDSRDETTLESLASDSSEDERIRLEAWGSLAKIDPGKYTSHLFDAVMDRRGNDDRFQQALAMECIFLLSEQSSDDAADALRRLASNPDLDAEARAAAVWSLGTTGLKRPSDVLGFIADPEDEVALHALASVGVLDQADIARARAMLNGTEREAFSAAALLSEQGDRGVQALVDHATVVGPSRKFALVGLGQLSKDEIERAIGPISPELAEHLESHWAEKESWLSDNEMETPLSFLKRQQFRSA